MDVFSGPVSLAPVLGTRGPLSPELLHRMNAYWRAAKYPSGGQIYVLWLYLLPEIRNWTWNSPGGP